MSLRNAGAGDHAKVAGDQVEALFASLARLSSDSPWAAGGAGAVAAAAADEIDFSGGVPDPSTYPLDILDDVLPAVLREDHRRALGYDTSGGFTGLQTALVERLSARGAPKLGPSQIGVVNGSAGAMAIVATALLDPGDVVVAERLSWPGALRAFRLLGATVAYAPLDAGGLDPDGLQEVLSRLAREGRRVKFVYTIATSQNPTGTTQTIERRRQIAEIARRFGVIVVQDDAYGELWLHDNPVEPFLALAPERTIHLGSFSKTIAPGLRVGWTASSVPISNMLAKVRTELGTTPILQRLVAHFVERGYYDAHLAAVTELYRRRRDVLLQALAEHCAPYCRWNEPEAGFFVWMTLNHGDVQGLTTHTDRHHLRFLPGSYFSPDHPEQGGFRLSYSSLSIDQLEDGARRLGLALSEHREESRARLHDD